jgi:hypothetical protein
MPNHGFPLSVELDLPDLIREHDFIYESGTLLVLYTNGIIEHGHNIDEAQQRLLRAARDAVGAKASEPARVHRRERIARRPDATS